MFCFERDVHHICSTSLVYECISLQSEKLHSLSASVEAFEGEKKLARTSARSHFHIYSMPVHVVWDECQTGTEFERIKWKAFCWKIELSFLFAQQKSMLQKVLRALAFCIHKMNAIPVWRPLRMDTMSVASAYSMANANIYFKKLHYDCGMRQLNGILKVEVPTKPIGSVHFLLRKSSVRFSCVVNLLPNKTNALQTHKFHSWTVIWYNIVERPAPVFVNRMWARNYSADEHRNCIIIERSIPFWNSAQRVNWLKWAIALII